MLQTIYSPDVYTGTATTATYPFTFRILAKTDVVLVKKNLDTHVVTTLALTAGFTIADQYVNTDNGGNLVLVAGNLPTNERIFIHRLTALTQLINLSAAGVFPSAVISKEFDRTRMQIQELHAELNRALKFSLASIFQNIDVPDPKDSTYLTWLNNGLINGTLGLVSDTHAVGADAETTTTVFDTAMANTNYRVLFVTTSWQTTWIVTAKTTGGFTIEFGVPAPGGGGTVVYGVVA